KPPCATVLERDMPPCRVITQTGSGARPVVQKGRAVLAKPHPTVAGHSRLGTILAAILVAVFRGPHSAAARILLSLRVLKLKPVKLLSRLDRPRQRHVVNEAITVI